MVITALKMKFYMYNIHSYKVAHSTNIKYCIQIKQSVL